MHIMHYKSDNDLTQWMPAEIFLMGGGGEGEESKPRKGPRHGEKSSKRPPHGEKGPHKEKSIAKKVPI